MSGFRSWGRDCQGQGPTPQPSGFMKTQREVMTPAVACDASPGSGEASLAPGQRSGLGPRFKGHLLNLDKDSPLVSTLPKPTSCGL